MSAATDGERAGHQWALEANDSEWEAILNWIKSHINLSEWESCGRYADLAMQKFEGNTADFWCGQEDFPENTVHAQRSFIQAFWYSAILSRKEMTH